MDVLTFETCWAVNSEIIKQVASSWSIFNQSRIWWLEHMILVADRRHVYTTSFRKSARKRRFGRHQTTAKQKDNLPYIRHLVCKCVSEWWVVIRPNDACYEAIMRERVSVFRSALQHRTSSITHIKLSFSEAQIQTMNIQWICDFIISL